MARVHVDDETGSRPALALGHFDDFYRSQYPCIVRLLYGLTGRWALSEELAQDSMIEAHRCWDRVCTLDRPDLWLRRVAINKAISARRRMIGELAAIAKLRDTREIEQPASLEDQQVWREIRRLPRRQAAAIVLWAVEDLPFQDIGDTLGCTDETARTHVRRARDALRHTLRPMEDQ